MTTGPGMAAAVGTAVGAAVGATMRTGTVVGYLGGVVTVDIDGTLVPAKYGSRYNPAVGDVVVLLADAGLLVVVDSLATVPGQFVPQVAEVASLQSTTSATFTDLATPGPSIDVTVGNSGRVLVLYSVQVGWQDLTPDAADGGDAGIDVSGASTRPPTPDQRLRIQTIHTGTLSSAVNATLGGMKFFEGLTPGPTRFTLKYRSIFSPKQADFDNRMIAVLPQ